MPLNFFAPDQRYAGSGPLCGQHDEFREMVRALHQADIEVVTDVVYNHTSEGDAGGPVASFLWIVLQHRHQFDDGDAQVLQCTRSAASTTARIT